MRKQINVGDAESLAINSLIFLADDSELLSRFLALTGITADQISAWRLASRDFWQAFSSSTLGTNRR